VACYPTSMTNAPEYGSLTACRRAMATVRRGSHHRDGGGRAINIAENGMTTRLGSKAEFGRIFGTDLPPLPRPPYAAAASC
jgi:hypothetical protein